ncbi:putative long-chain-fatty-acid--CoA ligase [Medicago truncatula]|uniref:Long-chain-fatty-acid--CoA ligase n=1 Tax=Medicago truncatula TaxID=3880 RepID=A0A396H718_MEDTR|nr:putative long-chain-fatty-acid--CoA ligase [Medicago truncatula]
MKSFAAKVEEGREGKNGKLSVGPVYRNLLAKDQFPPSDPDLTTAWDIFSVAAKKYPQNRMLGWREFVDGKFGSYVWKTYKQVYDEVMHIGSALRASGAQHGSRIGVYGSNCPQWIVAMEACCAHSLVCVPLYDTLAIVCFTKLTNEEKDKATSIGVKPYSWEEFLQMGKETPSTISPPQAHDICTIMYTSGTSGDPKGVVLTHENITYFVRGMDIFMEQFEDKMTVEDVYLSFLPLAHILDRTIEEYFFHKGASVGYYHGDLTALRDDLMELKPTLFAGVPRVFEKVYEGIKKAVEELNPVRRTVFGMLYKRKLGWMKKGYKHCNASPFADLLAFRKVKARLGGRVRLIITGGAPLSSEIEEFLRVTSGAFVCQGYGLTETCGSTTLAFPDEMCMLGTVGPVSIYNEIQLEEVPEMGYNPLGNPSCGEICLRGKSVFSGYHKNPELTKESIVDGWFHTGDIGEMQPNGVVKIIDRKKNLIKLSQGEYIALEYLENVYGITPIVEDVWVYGNSFKSVLVAVVVPNEEITKKWAYTNGFVGSFSELCSLDEFKKYVLSELKLTAERNKLKGFEQIKGVILDPHPFDMERDLVTATLKKRRNNMLKYYQGPFYVLLHMSISDKLLIYFKQVEIDEVYQRSTGDKHKI